MEFLQLPFDAVHDFAHEDGLFWGQHSQSQVCNCLAGNSGDDPGQLKIDVPASAPQLLNLGLDIIGLKAIATIAC